MSEYEKKYFAVKSITLVNFKEAKLFALEL